MTPEIISHRPSRLSYAGASRELELAGSELVAPPARRRIAAGEISKQRILCVAALIEAEATVGRPVLIAAGHFDENAVGEGGELYKHGSLLSVWAGLPAA